MVNHGLPEPSFWKGRRVLVTGHTGFKGGWLTLWLGAMQAEVHGFALDPPTDPSLFAAASVAGSMASTTIADIRDYDALSAVVRRVRPEVVFHLAAQSLVRVSYERPVDTYAINVMGAVHLLEAVRQTGGVRAVVNVTSDKCYENNETRTAYREHQAMGGHDPYSSSKGCAELVTAAYRRSFLHGELGVASARAGNVIGGGDWARDRLVPDILRALDDGEVIAIRSPQAIRPWQHVLEPVSGYLLLAERLHTDAAAFAEAWNFGPGEGDAQTVGRIVEHMASRCAGIRWTQDTAAQPHEAGCLMIDSGKARERLGWRPRWALAEALDRTLDWHLAWRERRDLTALTLEQIEGYRTSATRHDVAV